MMDHPHLLRCITILGHLHHGKTTFVQTLVDQTHTDDVNIFKEVCSCVVVSDLIRSNIPTPDLMNAREV